MRIGIDFDNTIVSYDTLFHSIALERGVIPNNFVASKIAIRDFLRRSGKEDLWTLIQGEAYGIKMSKASCYQGFMTFAKKAQEIGVELVIISHKTKYPFVGPEYDLHEAARNWIKTNIHATNSKLKERIEAYFELTKEKKIARIAALDCDIFIDDLPEILVMPGFPSKTSKILFDPECCHNDSAQYYQRLTSWKNIRDYVFK